jgi:hypothetical protein
VRDGQIPHRIKACKTARFPFFSESAFCYFELERANRKQEAERAFYSIDSARKPNARIGKRVFYFLITLKL